MAVQFTIMEDGLLVNAEFDDMAGLAWDADFQDMADYLYKAVVVIPNGATRIGERAFYDKRWLANVRIPAM